MVTAEKELQQYFKHLQDDFAFFQKETWLLNPTKPKIIPSRMQYDMAWWMQYGPKRRGLRGFRGFSKTWELNDYILWRFYRDPHVIALLSSQSLGHSQRSLRMDRRWLRHIPFLRHLQPRPPTDQRDSATELDLGPVIGGRDPSLTAVGITGQMPGIRANVVGADDVETPENSMTREQRVRLLGRIDEHENILLPNGDCIYIGTDQNEESVYAELAERGYIFRAYPIMYPTPEQASRIPDLAPILIEDLKSGRAKPGDPIWPERFGREFIIEKRGSVGKQTWAMQFMLLRGMLESERYPLRLSDLIMFKSMHRDLAPASLAWGQSTSRGPTAIEDIPSVGFGEDQFYGPVMVSDEWVPYQGCVAFLDPAGRGGSSRREPDEMAWAIVGQLHGYLYAKHVDGVRGGATQENLERIVLSLREHDARELWIEKQFGGEYLVPLFEPIIRRHTVRRGENDAFPNGWSCSLQDPLPSKGQKEIRIIDALDPIMTQHRLVVSSQVAENTVLMRQMTRLTRERGCLDYDDRIEALGGAVARFKDLLHQDADVIVKRDRLKKQLDLLKKYSKLYQTAREPSWMEH